MKSLTTALVLACSLLALFVVVSAVNVTYGTLDLRNSHLVAKDNVHHKAAWITKHKDIIYYPPKGHVEYKVLSAIRVLDYGGRKNFGYTTLLAGGPGHRDATIQVKSQTRKPVNITIEYYANN